MSKSILQNKIYRFNDNSNNVLSIEYSPSERKFKFQLNNDEPKYLKVEELKLIAVTLSVFLFFCVMAVIFEQAEK